MNRTSYSLLNTLFILICSFCLLSCTNSRQEESSSTTSILRVEKQHSKLEGTGDPYYVQMSVDVPIDGPTPLLDSIKAFLNEKLHEALELAIDTTFRSESVFLSAESVYSNNMPSLLNSYTDKYREIAAKCLSNSYNLNLFLIAQTESFVTYGLEWHHCGGSCGSEYLCYTFCKKDGRRVKDILSPKKKTRFVKTFNEDFDNVSNPEDICLEAGLTSGGLLVTKMGNLNHYQQLLYPYKSVLAYLTKEAKQLVKQMGDSSAYSWSNCFVGSRIGELRATDGKTIILTEGSDKKTWAGEGLDLYETWPDDRGTTPSVRAYYVMNDQYIPAPIFDGKSDIVSYWDELFSTNPTECVNAFNPANSTLYIPLPENVMMGEHNCLDRYSVYQFDGQKFVYHSEEGGFWIHPSLRNFGRLLFSGKSDKYRVRIDEMRIYDDRYDEQYKASLTDTCRYRYAAWKDNKNTQESPDLVIENGYYSQTEKGYVFLNKGYKYVVIPAQEILKVYQDDKLLMETTIFNDVTHWQ